MNPTQKLRHHQQKRIVHHAQTTNSYSFFNLLTSPQLLSVVEEQLPDHRERLYPPTTTLSLFLAQAMNADASCRNTVNTHVVERVVNGLSPISTLTGGYCKARQRLPTEMILALVKQTGRLVTDKVPAAWQWQGRPVKLVDGTTVSMPDTPANQCAYPQQSGQQPGLGFPIARIVAILCLSSGTILDAAMGACQGKGTSEHALFRQLLESLNPGDVILADRYYCSYFLIAMLLEKGVDVAFQQHAVRKMDFRTGQRLSARDHIVAWQKPKIRPDWMSQEQYEAFPEELDIRELKAGKMVLVTTLLSDKEAPKKTLAALYQQRWHVELDLRNIKITLGMESLRCKTPQMNEKEMWVYFLAYNLIRLVMAEAAVQADLMPRQLSFKHTLQIWLIWSKRQFGASGCENTAILFMLIASQRVGNRSGRIEPRAVKRRPKPYSLLMKPRDEARMEALKNGHPGRLK